MQLSKKEKEALNVINAYIPHKGFFNLSRKPEGITNIEYAKILEDFICTAWMWPDLVCFGIDHGYGEADLERASQQLKKIS